MTAYAWSPARSARALVAMRAAPHGPVGAIGNDLAQGTMAALVGAELLAAHAGVVPLLTIDGNVGVTTIGAARDGIDKATDPGVRTLYLAAHGAARRLNQIASPLEVGRAIVIGEAPKPIGILGIDDVVIVLVVLGVAAIVGGAYYATTSETVRIQVEGQNAREVARLNDVTALAMAQVKAGGKVDPALYKLLEKPAAEEGDHASGFLDWIVKNPGKFAAGVAVAAAGYGAYRVGFAEWARVHARGSE